MPLQQINVSPLESKEHEHKQNFESQMPGRTIKSQESCGRSESQASSQSSSNTEICRICHCEGDTETSLIAPCYCSGSLRYVHQICLQQWIKSSNIRCCELCKFQFIMHTKTKPFMEWEPLEMTGFERRKLLCAVMFHAIALTCVVWSLYVLIDRTAEEIKLGLLEWPFWTKLIVVAVGFTGGVIFMYIQCRAYMQICQRWKAFNRVIYVQNAPEKQPLPSPITLPSGVHCNTGDLTGEVQRPESKLRPQDGNFKEETSIDLKGVRNVHIFFNDENRVCVQNEQLCLPEECQGTSETGNSGLQRVEDVGGSWHIKIGKGSESTTSSTSLRCSELETMPLPTESNEQSRSSKNEDYLVQKCSDLGSSNIGDSVLKLQIKKAEIVIKFGQKSSCESSSEDNPNMENKDTSVNIKIDDKESEPIVIDVVEPKDPVEIRFDFSPNDNEKGCESGDESLNGASTKLLGSQSTDNFSHYETDSGSQSPLLSNKNNSQFQPN